MDAESPTESIDTGDKRENARDMTQSPGAAKKPSVKYHLHVGKQQIQYKQHQPSQAHLPRNSSLQYVSFFGKCYHCKYSAHSQKYCPLRQCQQCKEYGHSESVCWKLKPPQSSGGPAAGRHAPRRTARTCSAWHK